MRLNAALRESATVVGARRVWLAALLCGIALSADAQPSSRRIIRPDATDRPYSPGVLVGRTLYISGQLGLPGDGPTPAAMDVQARQAMEGVGAVLKAAGLGYEHLVKCHVYLADMEDYAAMNAAYGSYFKDRVPARTTVQAAALPSKAGVEIGCIAYADLAGISVVRPPAGALPAPLGPYSPAVWAGDTLYVSGMGGQDPATRMVGEAVTAQVAQTLANVTTTLTAAGLSHGDVVSVQAYGTQVPESASLGEALKAGLGAHDVPRGQVVLPRLPGPIRAELTFVAARPTQMRERVAGTGRVLRAGRTAYVAADVSAERGADTAADARALLMRLRTLLRGVRLDLRDVAHVTMYLSDIADLPTVNAVYKEMFPDDPPARATVQVTPQATERIRIALIAAQ